MKGTVLRKVCQLLNFLIKNELFKKKKKKFYLKTHRIDRPLVLFF